MRFESTTGMFLSRESCRLYHVTVTVTYLLRRPNKFCSYYWFILICEIGDIVTLKTKKNLRCYTIDQRSANFGGIGPNLVNDWDPRARSNAFIIIVLKLLHYKILETTSLVGQAIRLILFLFFYNYVIWAWFKIDNTYF